MNALFVLNNHADLEHRGAQSRSEWSRNLPRARRSVHCGWPLCLLLLAMSLGLSTSALATEENDGIWTIFTTTDTFTASDDGPSRWHYWFDAQIRYTDIGSGINQWVLRPGIGYSLNDNVVAWAGYARLRARGGNGNTSYEDRFWQQLTWSAGQWMGGKVSMRARLEQRSLSTGNDLGLVLRLNTKYVRPIGDDGTTSLILALEPFVDLRDTDWGGESGLGQNRAYVGIGWRASDRTAIETGYMNQFSWSDRGEDRSNHLGVINFKVTF